MTVILVYLVIRRIYEEARKTIDWNDWKRLKDTSILVKTFVSLDKIYFSIKVEFYKPNYFL